MAKKSTGNFTQAKAHSAEIEQNWSEIKELDDAIEKMYLLEWADKPTDPDVKVTLSPQPRNVADGAIRLMSATDPTFSVPFDKTDEQQQDKSEKVEKACAALWFAASRVKQMPIHDDIVTSAVLYARFAIGVTSTKDLLEASKGNPLAEKRLSKIAQTTPFLFDVYNPRTCFPEFDELGMATFYRKVKMKSGAVLAKWGKMAEAAGLSWEKLNEDVDYCDYWDALYHYAWIEGKGSPLMEAEHGLPDIPIVFQIVDGSSIHEKQSNRAQPFLATLHKTRLWERQNLSLTVAFTNTNRFGNNPIWVAKMNDPEKDISIDTSLPGAVIKMASNETLDPLRRDLVDRTVMDEYQTAKQLGEESTMYNQTLGQPLTGEAYSTIALLNQSGRLPLVSIQKRSSAGIGKAMEIAFEMMKYAGKGITVTGANGVINLSPNDIPENLVVKAKLDINMPQDDRQNAQIARELTSGDDPLVSKRFAREEYLGVGQSNEMSREIIKERLTAMKLSAEMQKQVAQIQAEAQAAINPRSQPGQEMSPQAPMEQPQPQQPDPSQMPADYAQPGLPQMGPMQPQQGGPMNG